MKVGDLVRCPAYQGQNAYYGIILDVDGYKATIGGGTSGKEVWDLCDICLVRR